MEQVLSGNLVISIDAMGGDNSPRVVIEGLALAAKKNPDVRFLLFGDENKILQYLNLFPALKKVCEIRPSAEIVRNDDKPSQVIRNKNTSMYMAIDAVRKGEAKAVVSAGNTGALMAISKLVLRDYPAYSPSGHCQHYAASQRQICHAGFGCQHRM